MTVYKLVSLSEYAALDFKVVFLYGRLFSTQPLYQKLVRAQKDEQVFLPL